MPKASEIKPGHVVAINNSQYVVRTLDVRTPSARGAATLYKMVLNDIRTGQKLEQSLKGDDILDEVETQRCDLSYLYNDGEFYTFMDSEDYAQYQMSESELADQVVWLSDGLTGIQGILVEGNLAVIELPNSVVVEVIETTPPMKGATATKSAKPAKVTGGININVPEYVQTGDKINVNPSDKKFLNRAN